jgi:CxxC motif-containing protein
MKNTIKIVTPNGCTITVETECTELSVDGMVFKFGEVEPKPSKTVECDIPVRVSFNKNFGGTPYPSGKIHAIKAVRLATTPAEGPITALDIAKEIVERGIPFRVLPEKMADFQGFCANHNLEWKAL